MGVGGRRAGLGIGLAPVRRLVEMHDGSITAYSDGPGEDSEFLMRLPLRAPASAELTPLGKLLEETVEDTMNEDARVTPRRILVADDNADALESLAMLLQLGGHSVYTAGNGQQTLESAERYHPEVALLDIGMPEPDGYEVARRIRAQPWGQDMTLVALTGWGQDSDRRLSEEAGFDSHLVKPVDLEDLTEVLSRGRTGRALTEKAP
jgi:CheY-like chemotaxis protein